MQTRLEEAPHNQSKEGLAQGGPEIPVPQFFTFLRNSVGAGEIKGTRERWIAPAALYTAPTGISESAWTTTAETVLAIRLRGGAVEDHNRGTKRTSGPGRDFALQPTGTPTKFLCFSALRFGHVFLPDALIDRASEGLPALSGRLRDDLSFVPEPALQTLICDYLRRAFDTLTPAMSLEMEGRALLLVDALWRAHEPLRAGQRPRTGGLSPRHLRRVCEFIVENLADDIYLDDLAGLTGLSCKHFVRAFKQSVGLAPHQYLIVQRIKAAQHRLLDASAGLADIALQCGFADQSHFSTTFRKVVGVSPRAWREEQTK